MIVFSVDVTESRRHTNGYSRRRVFVFINKSRAFVFFPQLPPSVYLFLWYVPGNLFGLSIDCSLQLMIIPILFRFHLGR